METGSGQKHPRARVAGLLAAVLAAVALVTGALVLVLGGVSDDESARPGGRPAPANRLFAPDSVWNAKLSGRERLDPRSRQVVASLNAQVALESRRGNGPWINTYEFSTPIYTVPKGQPTTRVHMEDRPGVTEDPALIDAWRKVPIPPDVKPARGTDGHLTLWQPSTDTLWEFFKLTKKGERWQATWGGAMRNVSKSPGYFSPKSWPGAKSYWGASATSLPVAAGTIRIDELRKGRIDHALALAVPNARAKQFTLPAQRTDGVNPDPDSVPEGAHFRLDPKLDLNTLDLDPAVRAIAQAAQRYGIVVRDQSGVVTFYGEDPVGLGNGSNPYPRLFGDKYPSQLLKQFPWAKLQLLPTKLREGQS